MNESSPNTPGGELATDVAAIDDALTDIFLRIHTMRQRWPREGATVEARLAMLAVEDITDALQGVSRKIARLRRCMIQ